MPALRFPSGAEVTQFRRGQAHGVSLCPLTYAYLMPKPNYQFEKRQRELAKKQKKAEKSQRKTEPPPNPAEPTTGEAPPPSEA